MDYYELLGIRREATAHEVRRAYRRLARRYHPDVTGEPDGRFRELADAYQVLHDPEERARYDHTHPPPRQIRQRPSPVPRFTARPRRDVPRFLGEEDSIAPSITVYVTTRSRRVA